MLARDGSRVSPVTQSLLPEGFSHLAAVNAIEIESFPSAIRKDRSGVSVSVCFPVPFENGLKLRDERNRSLRARVLRFPDSPAPHTAQHADYSERAVITCCVGATLYRGSQSTPEGSASKCSVSTSLRRESRWDPHVEHLARVQQPRNWTSYYFCHSLPNLTSLYGC